MLDTEIWKNNPDDWDKARVAAGEMLARGGPDRAREPDTRQPRPEAGDPHGLTQAAGVNIIGLRRILLSQSSSSLDASPETATGESAFRPGERESSVRSRTAGSRERFERARKSLAGGVSSGVRASARPYPIFFREGNGSRAVDVDGNAFVDYGLAWGPLILGQSPPEVVRAISEQIRRGLTFGAQHDLEYEVAERLTGIIPCADSVAFANSGTEIVQVALRLARAATAARSI